MQLPIKISSIEEYKLAESRNYQPLQDWKYFELTFSLRETLQKELFGRTVLGRGNVPQANQRFYEWCWNNSNEICEECGKPLGSYSSVYVSHIIGRGARADMAHDGRNKNILCFNHHQQWEDSEARKTMRIYKSNLKVIELLKSDYNGKS